MRCWQVLKRRQCFNYFTCPQFRKLSLLFCYHPKNDIEKQANIQNFLTQGWIQLQVDELL